MDENNLYKDSAEEEEAENTETAAPVEAEEAAAENQAEDLGENDAPDSADGAEETEYLTDDVLSCDEEAQEKTGKSKKGVIGVIIVAAIVVVLGVYLVLNVFCGGNKYNKMGYADISGATLGEMCEQMGMSVEDFKEKYELPEDMPEDTYFNAAYNMMPTKIIAAMNMTDFATLKEEFKLPEMTTPSEPKGFFAKIKSLFVKEKPVEITEDTPWGVVQDEITLEVAVGEDNMDEFREVYGFGDEVTLETKWKEVRPAIEKMAIEERKKAEQEAEEPENEEETDGTADGAAENESSEGETSENENSEDAE